MFETLSLLALQQYWWILVSLIGALFVFMTFVQGGQTLLYTIASNEAERDVLVGSLGRKWELSFTSLVMFGGALFAAFPLFYSVSFGGAYYVWMAILFCFIHKQYYRMLKMIRIRLKFSVRFPDNFFCRNLIFIYKILIYVYVHFKQFC